MRTFALALFLVAVSAPATRADCPENWLSTGSYGHAVGYPFTTSEANFGPEDVVLDLPCAACYSWPLGYFRAKNTGAPSDWGANVHALNRFQLVGPASATPIAFGARVAVTGAMGNRSSGHMGLGEGNSATQHYNLGNGESAGHQPIEIALSHLPGDTFEIAVELDLGADFSYSPGDLQGNFQFFDVPAGYSLVACQGFEAPTPVRPMTWGALRALYR